MKINKLNKLVLTCLILIFFSGCEKEKNEISDTNFNIVFFEKTYQILNEPSILMERSTNYKAEIENWARYDGINKFMYSWNEKDHFFKESDLEIFFSRERLSEYGLTKPEHCIISVRQFKEGFNSFFLSWQNKAEKIERDSNRTYFIDFSYYYDENRDIKKYKYENNNYYYKWEIGSTTDSIYSNLDLKLIKKIFPEFKGSYKKINIDTIFVDYRKEIYTLDFFDSIKFKGYNLGYTRDLGIKREN